MKKHLFSKRRLFGAITSIVCSTVIAFTVSAETNNGITLNISTDKSEYTTGENVEVSISASNDSSYLINNISIISSLPSGFSMLENHSPTLSIEGLASGGSIEDSYVIKKSAETSGNVNPPVIKPTTNFTITDSTSDSTNDDNSNYEDVSSSAGIKAVDDKIEVSQINTKKFIIAFVISFAAIAGIAILIKRRKKIKKILSLFLVLGIVVPICGGFGDIDASAESGRITASTMFTYNGKKYTVSAVMTFTREQESSSPADEYYKDTSEEIISTEYVNESNSLSEKEAAAMLAERNFIELAVSYEYDLTGICVGETEINNTSDSKHPMYKTMYMTRAGDVWNILIVGKEIFACPLSYNFETDTKVEYIFGEAGALTCYADDNNKYYVTVPKDSVVAFNVIDKIDSETLEKLTFEEIDKL